MSWSTCYSGSNPIHKNLPPLMSDARLFTKLDPNCEDNDKLKRFLNVPFKFFSIIIFIYLTKNKTCIGL